MIEIRQYPATFYHNLRLALDLKGGSQFYVGMDNVLNTHPPLGLSGTGAGGTAGDRSDRSAGNAAIYDAYGRKVYVGVKARF